MMVPSDAPKAGAAVRPILGVLLLGLFGALLLNTYGAGMHALLQRAATFYAFTVNHAWLLVGLYLLRLPLLLPASLVIVLTGMICGPLVGELVAVAGLSLGATVEFVLVRQSASLVSRQLPRLARLPGWRERIRRRPFHSILLLRACFVPFDAVNVIAALAQAPLRPFVTATILGVAPTSLPIVVSGASIDVQAWLSSGHLWPDAGVIRWPYVLASLVLAALVAAHARYRKSEPPVSGLSKAP